MKTQIDRLAGPGERSVWHKRLNKWEPYDGIRLHVVPRYKTSGMSGDEWRYHVQVDFYFKGELVHEAGFSTMETAIMYLGREFGESTCPIPTRVIELEKTKCDQIGCANDAVGRFRIKRFTSQRGEWLDPSENQYHDCYRQFCSVHLRRGDCSREDRDANYEPLDGVTPDESTNVQESPSAQVFVTLDNLDDLPAAIDAAAEEVQGEAPERVDVSPICPECKHPHSPVWGGICVGCPCEWRPSGAMRH